MPKRRLWRGMDTPEGYDVTLTCPWCERTFSLMEQCPPVGDPMFCPHCDLEVFACVLNVRPNGDFFHPYDGSFPPRAEDCEWSVLVGDTPPRPRPAPVT